MMLEVQERTIEPDILVLELKGRMHLGNRLSDAESQARRHIQAGTRKMVLDLTGVEYIDSAALGMLLLTTGDMAKQGGRVLIAGANQRVMEVIIISRSHAVLDLHDNVDAAVQALA